MSEFIRAHHIWTVKHIKTGVKTKKDNMAYRPGFASLSHNLLKIHLIALKHTFWKQDTALKISKMPGSKLKSAHSHQSSKLKIPKSYFSLKSVTFQN